MAKRQQPGCQCCSTTCGCPTLNGTVTGCNSNVVQGVTVEAHDSTSGGTLLGSTTTDAGGNYSLSGLSGCISGNSIVVTFTPSSPYQSTSTTLTFTAGSPSSTQWACGATTSMGTQALQLDTTNYVCCVSCTTPITRAAFFVTDSNGTFSAAQVGGATSCTWRTAYQNSASVTPTAIGGNCVAGTGSCAYRYTVTLGGTLGTPTMTITRDWSEKLCLSVPKYQYCPDPNICGIDNAAGASVTTAFDCTAFTASGTPSPLGGNHLADPVGGSVSVSK